MVRIAHLAFSHTSPSCLKSSSLFLPAPGKPSASSPKKLYASTSSLEFASAYDHSTLSTTKSVTSYAQNAVDLQN